MIIAYVKYLYSMRKTGKAEKKNRLNLSVFGTQINYPDIYCWTKLHNLEVKNNRKRNTICLEVPKNNFLFLPIQFSSLLMSFRCQNVQPYTDDEFFWYQTRHKFLSSRFFLNFFFIFLICNFDAKVKMVLPCHSTNKIWQRQISQSDI